MKTDCVRHVDRIVTSITSGQAVHSRVIASWSRSAGLHGLDAASERMSGRLTESELRMAREQMGRVLCAAGSSMDRLFRAVGGAGCCVLLANRDGVPVERRGATCDDSTFMDWNLWTGARWGEADVGTNAIGTGLVEGCPITIHRDQHFLVRNTGLSCISAPIHDELGRLAGVLDVSTRLPESIESFMDLISHSVAEAARRIEAETFRSAFSHARIVMVPGLESKACALVAIDSDDLVVGATHGARRALRLNTDLSARTYPASDLLGLDAAETLTRAEQSVLMRALARAGGNVSAAARSLGISRATLHRKLARLRLDDSC